MLQIMGATENQIKGSAKVYIKGHHTQIKKWRSSQLSNFATCSIAKWLTLEHVPSVPNMYCLSGSFEDLGACLKRTPQFSNQIPAIFFKEA